MPVTRRIPRACAVKRATVDEQHQITAFGATTEDRPRRRDPTNGLMAAAYSGSNPWLTNLSVLLFSVTVRTTASGARRYLRFDL